MINNLKDIYKSINNKFPIHDCTLRDENEKGIYNSNRSYLCMIIDKRFEEEAIFRIMKPYIWTGKESGEKEFKDDFGWGWVDSSGNFIDNFENPIHGQNDDEYVIGFVEYKDNGDKELWQNIRRYI